MIKNGGKEINLGIFNTELEVNVSAWQQHALAIGPSLAIGEKKRLKRCPLLDSFLFLFTNMFQETKRNERKSAQSGGGVGDPHR
jgi:hypothetical protein